MLNLNEIVAYEDGQLDEEQTIEFFAGLIRSGQAWTLQGHYGRTAVALIDSGRITSDGDII